MAEVETSARALPAQSTQVAIGCFAPLEIASVASWVLSPSSARKIRTKVEKKNLVIRPSSICVRGGSYPELPREARIDTQSVLPDGASLAIVAGVMRSLEIPLLGLAAADLAASLIVGWFRPRAGRFILAAGAAALGVALALRGIAIGYVPLTQRPESIAGFVFCAMVVALATDRWNAELEATDWRLYRTLLLLPPLALLSWSLAAWPPPQHPVSLLVTVWYVIQRTSFLRRLFDLERGLCRSGCPPEGRAKAGQAPPMGRADSQPHAVGLLSVQRVDGDRRNLGLSRMGVRVHLGSEDGALRRPLARLWRARAPDISGAAPAPAGASCDPGLDPDVAGVPLGSPSSGRAFMASADRGASMGRRVWRFLAANDTGIGILLVLSLLFLIGSLVRERAAHAYEGLQGDDLRFFFSDMRWIDAWFWAILAACVLLGLSLAACAVDALGKRLRMRERDPRAYGAIIAHIGAGVALIAHAIGGWSGTQSFSMVGDRPVMIGAVTVRLASAETLTHPDGAVRRQRADLEVGFPDGRRARVHASPNDPARWGGGTRMLLLMRIDRVADACVLAIDGRADTLGVGDERALRDGGRLVLERVFGPPDYRVPIARVQITGGARAGVHLVGLGISPGPPGLEMTGYSRGIWRSSPTVSRRARPGCSRPESSSHWGFSCRRRAGFKAWVAAWEDGRMNMTEQELAGWAERCGFSG